MADPTRITAPRCHFSCLAAPCRAAVAAAHTIGSRPVRRLALFVLLALTMSLAGLGTTRAVAKMPLVRAQGAGVEHRRRSLHRVRIQLRDAGTTSIVPTPSAWEPFGEISIGCVG